MSTRTRPTVAEIRQWPATVDVPQFAAALGVSRAHGYECIRTRRLPAEIRTIEVGGRIKVITSSILAALGETA